VKTVYGAADCAAGCVVEPHRETVLVVTRSAADRAAQLNAASNSLALAEDLAAIAHSLSLEPPADRAAWFLAERAKLEARLAAAEAAERSRGGTYVLTLQRTDSGGDPDRAHEAHAHHEHGEADENCHGGDCHAHHEHGEADEHCHGDDCHELHAHGEADEHCHGGDCHEHHEHGEEACAAPVELGAGRRVVVGNATLTSPCAYTLAVAFGDAPTRQAVFAVEVRHARRAATALTPRDRSRFLRAVVALYETPAEAGRRRYGADFRSMDELWAAHALLGGDGEDHALLGGAVGADAAADLVERSRAHRVPGEVRAVGGHRLHVVGDGTDWEAFGRRFVGRAADRAALRVDGAPRRAASALRATGHARAHAALRSNFAAFGALLEAAVQSVDPAVAVPFWAAEAGTEDVRTRAWHGGAPSTAGRPFPRRSRRARGPRPSRRTRAGGCSGGARGIRRACESRAGGPTCPSLRATRRSTPPSPRARGSTRATPCP